MKKRRQRKIKEKKLISKYLFTFELFNVKGKIFFGQNRSLVKSIPCNHMNKQLDILIAYSSNLGEKKEKKKYIYL